jgi:hypothetical protein
MADITMCSPKSILPVCKDCYRRTAKASEWQSYCSFEAKSDNECNEKIIR